MNRSSFQTDTARSKGPTTSHFPTQAEFCAVVNRAAKGDEKAQTILRKLLDLNSGLWPPTSDLGNIAAGSLAALIAQRSFLMRESLQRRLAEVRDQLIDGQKGPLLAILVHRVLTSWLRVEIRQVQAMNAKSELDNRKLQKRLDQAQRRHGESVVALRDFQYFPWDSDRGGGLAPTAPFIDPTDAKPRTPPPGRA